MFQPKNQTKLIIQNQLPNPNLTSTNPNIFLLQNFVDGSDNSNKWNKPECPFLFKKHLQSCCYVQQSNVFVTYLLVLLFSSQQWLVFPPCYSLYSPPCTPCCCGCTRGAGNANMANIIHQDSVYYSEHNISNRDW